MTIDWTIHEAEIRRLYWREGKPLPEVCDILSKQHGFEASLRSYRKILGKWGLLRRTQSDHHYQRRRTVSHDPSPSRRTLERTDVCSPTPSLVAEEGTPPDICIAPGIFIPEGDLNASQMQTLLQKPSYWLYGLEILLSKWDSLSSSDYLYMAEIFLSNHGEHLDIWRPCSGGNSIFDKIKLLPYDHAKSLTKSCLHKDLQQIATWKYSHCSFPEGCSWREACRSTSWRQAMDLMCRGPTTLWRDIPLRDIAICMIAERRLRYLKQSLETQMKRHTAVNESCELSDEGREYLEILKDIASQDIDINSSWYLYSLKLDRLLREYMENRLKGLRKNKEASYNTPDSERVQEVSPKDDGFESMTKFLGNGDTLMQLGPSESFDDDAFFRTSTLSYTEDYIIDRSSIVLQSQATAQLDFAILCIEWESGRDLESHVYAQMFQNSVNNSNFHELKCGGESLFSLVRNSLPLSRSRNFIRWFLRGLRVWVKNSQLLTGDFKTWQEIDDSSTWSELMTRFRAFDDYLILEMEMTFDAKNLLLDGILLLTGEHRFARLKPNFFEPDDNSNFGQHMANHSEYLAILRTFKTRGIEVDLSWLTSSLNRPAVEMNGCSS